MRKKVIKIVVIALICIVLINIVMMNINTCMAISDVTENPDFWLNTNNDSGGNILNQKMGPVLKIIRNTGVIISVLTLSVIALKIMFSSVEGKAEYKQKLLPWAIGAFMVFSMTTIPSLIYDLVYSEPEASQTQPNNGGTQEGGSSGGTGSGSGSSGHGGIIDDITSPEMDLLP